MEEYCICGHGKFEHFVDKGFLPPAYCEDCLFDLNVENSSHPFKLDNLKLVEDLAKERNLI
jgi:hypothetical protein